MTSGGGPGQGHGEWGAGDRGQSGWGQRPDPQQGWGQGQQGTPQWGQSGSSQQPPSQWGSQGQPQQWGNQQHWGQQPGQWNQQGGQGQPQWGQQGPGQVPPGGQPPQGGRSGPNLPLIIGIGVAVLVLVGGLIWWATRPSDTTADPQPPASTAPATGGASSAPPSRRPASSAPPTGGSAPTGGADAPQTGEVGKPIHFKTAEGEGEVIVHEAKWATEGIIPPDNGAYLGLDLEVKVTSGTARYGPLYVKGKDQAGREYSFAIGSGFKPQMSFGTVSAGQNARGWVALDAPKGPLTVSLLGGMLEPVAHVQVNA